MAPPDVTPTPSPLREKRSRRRSSADPNKSDAMIEEVSESPTKLTSPSKKTEQHQQALREGEDDAYEDPYGDEIEKEDVWVNEEDETDESDDDDDDEGVNHGMDTGTEKETVEGRKEKKKKSVKIMDDDAEEKVKVWVPGVDKMEEGGTLDFDSSAYDMLHRFNMEWPALSFDVLPDQLGMMRKSYPHTMYVVAGTQGESGDVSQGSTSGNKIYVMKWSRMMKTKKDGDDDSDEGSDEESDEEDEDEATDEDAVEDSSALHHTGAVNRIRVCPHDPSIVATWSERGSVLVYDITDHRKRVDVPTARVQAHKKPLFTSSSQSHKNEGYALNFSRNTDARFISGDCDGSIVLWGVREGGWAEVSQWGEWMTEARDKVSVEGIEFDPHSKIGESGRFAACGVDGTFRLFDVRTKSSVAKIVAHELDVNEVTWNPLQPDLLLTASEDGCVKVWDVRVCGEGGSEPLVYLHWHKKSISSARWSPHDEATFAVASADNSISIWDLSVEPDDDEVSSPSKGTKSDEASEGDEAYKVNYPCQLMFHHLGQSEIKELQWHPNIPGMLLSSGLEGFNIFKPSNI
eukprot:GHVN01063863.1.p1 GENE.GHVN01063863.1~~GHVN01063863.1.p1  ORF type:complete len:574 (-),score=147.28 GHVN01063863.1:221-1942(-)